MCKRNTQTRGARLTALVICLLLMGCTARFAAARLAAPADQPALVTRLPLSTVPEITATTPPATPTTIVTRQPPPAACAPLAGMGRSELQAAISNPYHPPPPGSDEPHHGVDLAVQQNGIALAGAPVQAVLAGTLAMFQNDRFPYGNAVIIETDLEDLPPGWLTSVQIPALAPTLGPQPVLTCPPADINLPALDGGQRSLYLLYAHMGALQPHTVGQALACGEQLGVVGQTGNALNPHLHFEVRVGPPGLRLGSIAHYDNSASLKEMGRYCLWRVSGVFQLIDPVQLLGLVR